MTMTPSQFRAALNHLALTQGDAARLLGVSLRTAHGYAHGDSPIPEGFARLLRLMIKHKLTMEDVW